MGKNKGFTLIELLIVIAMVSIMTMIAIPTLQQSSTNNRQLFEAQNIYNILGYARTESSRRNDYVSVCPSTNSSTCSGTDYSQGAIVYLNSAQTGLSSNTQIIKIYDPWTGSDKGKAIGSFSFNGQGFSTAGTSSVLICNPTYNSYTVTVNNLGKSTIVKNAGDGGC